MVDKAKEQILINEEITPNPDILSTTVTRRLNAIDDAMLIAVDTAGKEFLATLNVGDDVEIQYQWADDPTPTWVTVFKGAIQSLNPNMSKAGEIVSASAYGKGFPFKNCRIATEYGTQSKNSTINTIGEIISYIIEDWVNKLLNDQAGWDPLPDPIIESGYNITASNSWSDDTHTVPYILFKWQDVFSAIQDMMKLAGSAAYIDDPEDWVGLHWIVDTEGRFMYAKVGNHEAFGISTYWATHPLASPIVVKADMISHAFQYQIGEANAVAVSCRFSHPASEWWTEGHASEWTEYTGSSLLTISNESTIVQIGDYSLKVKLTGGGITAVYHAVSAVNINKIGTKHDIPELDFWIQCNAAVQETKIMIGTDKDNYFYYNVAEVDGQDDKWVNVTVPIGQYALNTWTSYGSPDWTNINVIGFVTGGNDNAIWYVDGLEIVGAVIVLAYDSAAITAHGVRFLTVKDSLSAVYNLDANDESNPAKRVALGELLRRKDDILTGQIMISLNPYLMAGQIVRILASKREDGTYQIDDPNPANAGQGKEMRITEVQHTFTPRGAITQLSLCDDLKNSVIRPNASSDSYNTIIQCVNPDFQSRTLASLKTGGDFDPDLTVIAKDYAP